MFKKNDLVMYGAIGVCRVTKIDTPDFVEDNDRLYYFLDPVFQSGAIYAPIDNEKVSIRPVISADEAKALIEDIDSIKTDDFKSRSMQQLSQHYQEILDTHNCRELLSLTKTIYKKSIEASEQNKNLGQIDKRFMKKAEDLLFGEFAVALNTDREAIGEKIYKRFSEQ